MHQSPVGIAPISRDIRPLPSAISSHAKAKVPLNSEPGIFPPRQTNIFRQLQAHLRNRTRIDAQRLTATAQRLMLHRHGALLCSHGEAHEAVINVGIQLLHDEIGALLARKGIFRSVVYGNDKVSTVSQLPRRRLPESTRRLPHTQAQIPRRLLKRRQTMPVARQPQRRPALTSHGRGTLHTVSHRIIKDTTSRPYRHRNAKNAEKEKNSVFHF